MAARGVIWEILDLVTSDTPVIDALTNLAGNVKTLKEDYTLDVVQLKMISLEEAVSASPAKAAGVQEVTRATEAMKDSYSELELYLLASVTHRRDGGIIPPLWSDYKIWLSHSAHISKIVN